MKNVMVNFIYKEKLISRQRMKDSFKKGDEVQFGDINYKVINRKRQLLDIDFPAEIQHNCGDYLVYLEKI